MLSYLFTRGVTCELFKIFQIEDCSKIILLLDRDISDPWYTRDFEATYQDIYEGILTLYKKLSNR